MAYVPTKVLLEEAHKNYYAVGAFNINNLEFLQAILAAAEEARSPVLIETSEGAIKYAGKGDIIAGAQILCDMVRTMAARLQVPVSMHLDHGKDLKYIMAAIKAGYGSVMIDASDKPFEENLSETSYVTQIAHAAGVSVEAELGTLKGIEDNVVSEESILVNPDEAQEFVERTKVDFLAPAIGTSHGAFKFKGEAKLDMQRLQEVKKRTNIPLVLHGASSVPQDWVEIANQYGGTIAGAKGLPLDVLKETISHGINKVNTDTDLRITFIAVIRKVLAEKGGEIDPRKIFSPAIEAVKSVIMERMEALGSCNKV
jgi:fructose-bisphosphate aldolase class II